MRKSAADRHTQRRLQRLSRRALLLGAAQAGGFLVLAGRMYQLQVQEADRYRTLADKNRIGLRLEVATRGLILDRYDRPMALNQTAYRVAVVPEEAGDLQRLLERLDRLVPLTEEQRERVLVTARRQRSFLPIIAYEDLTWQEIARIGVHTADLPGVEVSETKQRVYPEGEVAAHLVGYVGAVSEQELTADPVLALPDFRIGKSGVERIYDRQLRGEAGRRQVEVNAVGRTIRDLRRIPETPGENLQLSIDVELQKLGVERFGEQTGAAVVMNVHTGEILSLVSRPSYDPGLFVGGISRQDWERLIKAPDAPLVNKAIAGQYAPGSTFKMIVALAALESGLIKPSTDFFCTGALEVGDGRFHCWRRGGHGRVDLHNAVVQSCDVYFYEVARRIGIARIAAMARRLGFGSRLGIDLPGELSGLMPDKEWKRERLGQPWQIGDSLIAGIGQGYVLATPLQLAVMTARLVNGGHAITPRLTQATELPAAVFPSLELAEKDLAVVVKSMIGVTNEPKGTASSAQIPAPAFRMGGKTGTSQVRRISARERRLGVLRNEDRPREHRDHALFVGFAPIAAPVFATSVIVEHGGGGSKVAAPIARDLLLEAQIRARQRRA